MKLTLSIWLYFYLVLNWPWMWWTLILILLIYLNIWNPSSCLLDLLRHFWQNFAILLSLNYIFVFHWAFILNIVLRTYLVVWILSFKNALDWYRIMNLILIFRFDIIDWDQDYFIHLMDLGWSFFRWVCYDLVLKTILNMAGLRTW